jgi:hypothetical protein
VEGGGGNDGGGIVWEYHLNYWILQTYMHILDTFGALNHVQSIIEIDHMINRDDGKICTLHVPRSSYTFAFHVMSFKILVNNKCTLEYF